MVASRKDATEGKVVSDGPYPLQEQIKSYRKVASYLMGKIR